MHIKQQVTDQSYEDGRGGDLVFQTGIARNDDGSKWPDGAFVFKLPSGVEALRIAGDGAVYVRGELVKHDADLYEAFRDWVKAAHFPAREPHARALGRALERWRAAGSPMPELHVGQGGALALDVLEALKKET